MKTILECRSADGGRETRAYSLSIKAAGEDGTIEGYGSVFGNVDEVPLESIGKPAMSSAIVIEQEHANRVALN